MDVWEYQRLPESWKAEAQEFVRAHGFDPSDVFRVESSVVDTPMLTIWVYDVNEDGKRFLRHKDDKEAAYHTEDVLLKQSLPAWWRD